MNNKPFIYVLIRSWKNLRYFDKCIDSVKSQKYERYKILYVDDASGYKTNTKKYIKSRLNGHLCIFNRKRRYSIRNAYNIINKFARAKNSIIFNLDGDDWLPNENCFSVISDLYVKNPKLLLTYGDCLIWDGKKARKRSEFKVFDDLNSTYKKEIINGNHYRTEPFLPLHPRTWKVSLYKKIPKKEFYDSNGKWLKFAEDQAIFFPLLERSGKNYMAIKNPIYVYNISNSHRDVVENKLDLLKDELEIRRKYKSNPKTANHLNTVNVYYSKVLSLPIIGKLLYDIERILIKNGLVRNVFVSPKNSVSAINTLELLSETTNTLLVKSTRICKVIHGVKTIKVLDLRKFDIKKLSTPRLYDLMWTLVYCDFVTENTKALVKKILPSDYPVFNK